MGIFDRLFGKKKDSEKKTIKNVEPAWKAHEEKKWEDFQKNQAAFIKENKLKKQELKQELKKLKEAKEKIISKLEKSVDEIENNDEFNKLLNKYEKEIAEIDRKHIKDFVKLSSYLKTKEKNIQSIFSSIKDTANKNEVDLRVMKLQKTPDTMLKEYVGILKNEIHSYRLILYNALNMIVALVEDKPIIFYEIYESFDKLDVFNSNYENEVSKKLSNISGKLSNISGKLSNIGDGLNDLMYSIHQMGADIVAEIGSLSYVTEESSRMLGEKLKEVNSSVETNNLLAGIQAYQLYKLNKSNRNRLK